MKRLAYLIAALSIATLTAWGREDTPSAVAQQAINPADFSPRITHPLFPLSLVGPKVILGKEEDGDDVLETRLESKLLPRTEVIAGVTVAIWEERAYEDGELVEVALDYFAQHKDGDVYYFGEHVDNYEGGVLKNHNGQWFAGENGNLPGILMPAKPVVGRIYQQEYAPGIAEDMIMVLSINETVEVKAGLYQQCLKTLDYTPLEPGLKENKWFCPGVGMVKEQGEDFVAGLVSVGPAPAQPAATAAPSPATAAAPAAVSTGAQSVSPTAVPPAARITAPSTGDGGLADNEEVTLPLIGATLLVFVVLSAHTAWRLKRN